MENKMAEVAKLLDVKLGEEFTLKDSSFVYRFTKSALKSRYRTENEWYDSGMLTELLTGKYQIIRKPRQSILDQTEKRYLTNIIKPFKDQVIAIAKGPPIMVNLLIL